MADAPTDSDEAPGDSDGTSTDDGPDPAERARRYVLDSHAGTVETVLRRADRVAETWNRDWTADPSEVADPLRRELDAAGAWADLPEILAGAVRATGNELPASPVAAPPYVAATGRGPMLRATLPAGRLVVLLQAFEIERTGDGPGRDGSPARYRRGPTTPADAVRATFK